MATKTYSFTIMGQFNKESFILAQAMLNDAFKTFPDVRVQSIQLTEWETTQEPVENNVIPEEEVLVIWQR